MVVGIYKITNIIKDKPYIGQSKNIKKRWEKHRNYTSGSRAITSALKLYGLDNFTFEIIHRCIVDDLDKWEIHYIKKYDSLSPNGYNLTTGGRRPVWSKVSRDRLRNAKLGKKASSATRLKMSIARRGIKRSKESIEKTRQFHIGRKRTKLTCQNIRRSLLGRKLSRQHKINIGKGLLGRKHSPEAILNMKKPNTEQHNKNISKGLKGKPKSVEHCKKNGESHSKKTLQFTLENVFVKEWNSATEASIYYGCSRTSICKACGGKTKTSKGFIWKYKS